MEQLQHILHSRQKDIQSCINKLFLKKKQSSSILCSHCARKHRIVFRLEDIEYTSNFSEEHNNTAHIFKVLKRCKKSDKDVTFLFAPIITSEIRPPPEFINRMKKMILNALELKFEPTIETVIERENKNAINEAIKISM